jgi:hypothetical protein
MVLTQWSHCSLGVEDIVDETLEVKGEVGEGQDFRVVGRTQLKKEENAMEEDK